MRAFETFAICATPFPFMGVVTKLLLQRYAISAQDVQEIAGTKPKLPRRVFFKWHTDG